MTQQTVSRRRTRTRTRAIAVGVVFLLAVVLGFLLPIGLEVPEPLPGYPAKASVGGDSASTNGQSINPSVLDAHEEGDGVTEEFGERVVVVTFRDARGNPVDALHVKIRAPADDQALKGGINLTTCPDGQVRISATDATPVEVELVDQSWCYAWRKPDEALSRKTRISGAKDAILKVRRVNTIYVHVRYADGVPYLGAVHALGEPSGIQVLEVGEDGSTSFLPGVRWSESVLRVLSRRPGFKSANFDLPIADEARKYDFVLPYDDDGQGGVSIDLSGFIPVQRVNLVISPAEATVRGLRKLAEVGISTDRQYNSTLLPPGAYVIRVWDATIETGRQYRADEPIVGKSWSANVEVNANQVTRVQAIPSMTCGVRAVILYDDGTPCSPAALSSRRDYPLSWGLINDPGGTYSAAPRPMGFSDADGRVVVYGLNRTEELIVEAQGCARQVLSVALTPGEVTDIGRVFLRRAIGTLVIRLLGTAAPEGQYRATLVDPWHGGVLSRHEFQGDQLELNHLEIMWYNVRVEALDSPLITNAQNVKLAAEAPSAEIVFQMRQKKQ